MKKHNKKRILTIALLFIICIVQTAPVSARETDYARTVRVSCGINNALYLNKDGNPEGYCSEYLKDLAKINHWNIEYVEDSWNNSVQNLKDGKIDLLFPTQMTEERKSTMGFSTSIGGYQPIGLFARKDSGLCYDDYEGFDGARIAVSEGTSNETVLTAYAEENGFTYEPVYINTTDEKKAALLNGTVDLIVFSTLNDVPDANVVAMIDYLPFYYCTNIEDTELLKELNYGMNQMLIRHPDIVENVFYNFMNGNISFAYTKEEQTAIDKHGKITVGVYQDTAPLFDVASDGTYYGIYADLLQRIAEISGLTIEVKALDRKEYAFDYLDQGDIDFVMGSSDQALKYSGATGYVQSDGMMDYYSIEITKKDFQLDANSSLIIALTGGRRYWASVIQDKYPNSSIHYYESSKDCLDAVQRGDASLTVLNSWEYNYQSKNHRYENLMEWENSRKLSETVFVSLDTKDELIRSIINKAIEQISNAEKEGIITANLNRPYSSYNFSDRFYDMRESIILFGLLLLVILVGFVVYIIMRRKSIQELEAKNLLLEHANASKDLFLSRMSHELRTPLNAINGYATVLEQNLGSHELDEHKIHEGLESILRATKYQLAIISDVLDIQKIESGKLELSPAEIDFGSYMESIVEMIQSEADSKKIQFSYERLTSVNDTYFLDGVRLQQALLNILHNAIKFTPVGGTVKMTAEVVDHDEIANTIKFVISDSGIGISEDFQKNYLFHRFAQEYQGNTSPYEGCGTGLAISREIIHLMGGEITCHSKMGEGSTFTVILTAKHIEKKKKNRERRAKQTYDLGGIRILLCEDNPMNQDMERSLLERMHGIVDIADDGQIGLQKFKASETGYYQIVLMDIRMPNMDGLETTKAIRALNREDAKEIPILAVSANAFEEDIQKSIHAGMNEHLAKPVDARILYEKIHFYCKRNTLCDHSAERQ